MTRSRKRAQGGSRPSKASASARGASQAPPDNDEAVKLPLGPGASKITLDTSALPIPSQSFYANTASVVREKAAGTVFAFSQVISIQPELLGLAVIEMPMTSVKLLRSTFNPDFLETANRSSEPFGPMRSFPGRPGGDRPAMMFSAHFARVHIADFGASLDFYELAFGSRHTDVRLFSRLRVQCLPNVAHTVFGRIIEIVDEEA